MLKPVASCPRHRKTIAMPKPQARRETDDAERARDDAIRAHDRHHERLLKANETAVQAGQIAIRTAVIVNGGAAVSVLAFIGGLVGQGRLGIQEITSVANSLVWFAAGIVCGIGSLGASYLAQYSIRNGVELKEYSFEKPYIRTSRASMLWKRIADAMRAIGILTGIASVALFVLGMRDVHGAITGFTPPKGPQHSIPAPPQVGDRLSG
jgi:hypothetical protein